jgi:putative transposase
LHALARMEEVIRAVCRDFGCEVAESKRDTEHVHQLIGFPQTAALSQPINSLKGVSSRRLRREFPELARHDWRARRPWSGPTAPCR